MGSRSGKQARLTHYLERSVKLVLLSGLIISIFFIFNQFKWSNYFPIKTVRIYGLHRVDQQEVKNLLLPLVDHDFFSINVEYMRDRLLQMPWVADILVRRNWPDQVEVTVVERHAVAKWNGEYLLSEMGDIFSPKPDTYPRELPEFIGPSGKQMLMLQYFNEMNRVLTPLHAKISYLELTPYLTWKLGLDNGMMLQIGHKDILTRLGHFVKVYPKIIGGRASDVEYVDLRYPNGVAIRWKTVLKT